MAPQSRASRGGSPAARLAGNPAVRTGSPRVARALEDGAARSPTFAGLLRQLADTDVIVFIEPAVRLPSGASGCLTFVAKTPSWRYMQILLDVQLARPQAIAIVGHELQHALEVASDPRVIDETTLGAMYLRIGRRADQWRGHEVFDSAQAIAAGRTILRELDDTSSAGWQDDLSRR